MLATTSESIFEPKLNIFQPSTAENSANAQTQEEKNPVTEAKTYGKPLFETLDTSLRAFATIGTTHNYWRAKSRDEWRTYDSLKTRLGQESESIGNFENFLHLASSISADPRFKDQRFAQICAENLVGELLWRRPDITLEDKVSITSFVLVQNLTFLTTGGINFHKLKFDNGVPSFAVTSEINGSLSFILGARFYSGKYATAVEKGMSAARVILSREPELKIEKDALNGICEGIRAEGIAWEAADMFCDAINIGLEGFNRATSEGINPERYFYDQIEQQLSGGKSSFSLMRKNAGEVIINERMAALKPHYLVFFTLASKLHDIGIKEVAIKRPNSSRDFSGEGDLLLVGYKEKPTKNKVVNPKELLAIDIKCLEESKFDQLPADRVYSELFTSKSDVEDYNDTNPPSKPAQEIIKARKNGVLLLLRVDKRNVRAKPGEDTLIRATAPDKKIPLIEHRVECRNPLNKPRATLEDEQGLCYAVSQALAEKGITT